MKCPKCGYNSFDHLQDCKKCGADLTEVKSRSNLRGIFFPIRPSGRRAVPVAEKAPAVPAFDEPLHSSAPPAAPPAGRATIPVGGEEGMLARETEVAEPFDDPHAFSLESLMTDTPSAAEADAEPEPSQAVDTVFGTRAGPGKDAAGADAAPAPPPLGEDDPLVFAEAAPGLLPETSEPVPSAPPTPSFSPGSPRGPVAVPVTAEAEDEEPLRISLDDFDRLEPGGVPFEAAVALPGLEGDFAGPAELSGAATPSPAAPVSAGDADPEPDAAVDEFPVIVFFPAVGARLTASVADLLILAAVFALFLLAGEIAATPAAAAPPRPLVAALLEQAVPYFLVLFFLAFGYFTFFHFLLGQTPGKMLLRLRVETEAGEPVTFSRAFLRSTGGLLALLTAGLGFLPALRRGGRGLNDRLAGTRVVLTGVPLAKPADSMALPIED